jgi:hypothetical protein
MTDIERFNKVWNGHFELYVKDYDFNNIQNITDDYYIYTKRGLAAKDKYEEILFSIWKHHQDYDDVEGFQLKCNYVECSEYRTLYRVRELAEESGLLIKVGNYLVGDHTNYYQKNHKLFDFVFRGKKNQYGLWLEKSETDVKYDKIYQLMIIEYGKLSKDNNYSIYNNKPYVDKMLHTKQRKSKPLNYDLEKLYALTDTLFPHYYNLVEKLNNSVVSQGLKFISFIHFSKQGLPTGRPYSLFCSTLNPNKKHKDTSGVFRPDFLKRIGLADYYEVYDIKSEIPRINHLFHTGEWKDDSYDFYSEIIKHSGLAFMYELNDIYISRGENRRNHYNDSMKQLFMRIYFGKGNDKQSYNGYKQEINKRNERNNKMYSEGLLTDDDLIDIMYKNKDMIDIKIWEKLCNSTREICGPSIGPLIFWYSFFIETEVKIELLKRGKNVINVYDGFYFNQDIKDEIIQILDVKSKYVYNKYMKPIKLIK